MFIKQFLICSLLMVILIILTEMGIKEGAGIRGLSGYFYMAIGLAFGNSLVFAQKEYERNKEK
ncbi:hypothetical protein [Anaeromicrobium sediminis]|uniref:Uncharacterized protein n=1 Tax=Anaeromicrobium sediminis TaxID=1478221 RepID=A0A267MNI4_9FIRM|nr:hypothetical protein [Anaeromicrobium sediminis]PAB60310.1 hypothetical protein CCE28_05285 [Anaeromicrobium sediminis]